MEDVLTALVNKRTEIMRDLVTARDVLAQLEDKLTTLEGAIRVFDPDIALVQPKRRPVPLLTNSKRGVMVRAITDTMRDAGKPLTCREIAMLVMERRRLPRTDPAFVTLMVSRTSNSLRRLRSEGYLLSESPGGRGAQVWRFV